MARTRHCQRRKTSAKWRRNKLRLWLDDERHSPYGWTWARTVEQAQTFVENSRFLGLEWIECSLDHDLGKYGGPGKEGHDFLRWMCETSNWPTQRPVVHTSNAYERGMMEQTIERYFPGGKLLAKGC